jgi:hypothetical protein
MLDSTTTDTRPSYFFTRDDASRAHDALKTLTTWCERAENTARGVESQSVIGGVAERLQATRRAIAVLAANAKSIQDYVEQTMLRTAVMPPSGASSTLPPPADQPIAAKPPRRLQRNASCAECGWHNNVQWRRVIRSRLEAAGGRVEVVRVARGGRKVRREMLVHDAKNRRVFRSFHAWWHACNKSNEA